MLSKSEIKFELLSSEEQEATLNQHGFHVSRREFNDLVVSLFLLENKYYEVYFYMRSHELVKIQIISEDQAFRQYQDLKTPLSRVA